MTRALVLGATGHIGAHVVRALLARGVEVRAAYRRPEFFPVLEGLPVDTVRVDLDRPAGLEGVVEGCEWVFHCAGYYPAWTAQRAESIERGLAQVRRVFDQLAAHRPARVVFTSSAATIAPSTGRPMSERDQEPWPLPRWRPLYATVKIAMEHEVLRHAARGLPIVIVNPSVCIGEYDAHSFSGRLVLLFAKRRLPFYLEHAFNAVYTGDVGAAHVLAAQRGTPGERYVLAGRNLTLQEFARIVAEQAGVAPPRWPLPPALALAAAAGSEAVAWLRGGAEPLFPIRSLGLPRRGQRLDGSKAVRELGMPQTPIEEAVARCLAWFRQHGVL